VNLIEHISSDPLQKFTMVLPDGTAFTFTLYFVPMQQGWFITELSYQSFILRGLRVSNSVNMLNQFRNLIPFGLGCISVANREPSLDEDFSSGNSKLYLLSQVETDEYAEYLKLG
jgi:hypothetical protein